MKVRTDHRGAGLAAGAVRAVAVRAARCRRLRGIVAEDDLAELVKLLIVRGRDRLAARAIGEPVEHGER